jgi:hypothetical protein
MRGCSQILQFKSLSHQYNDKFPYGLDNSTSNTLLVKNLFFHFQSFAIIMDISPNNELTFMSCFITESRLSLFLNP